MSEEKGAALGQLGLRITGLSIPCPAVCTAAEMCTWIQSVFRDVRSWALAAQASCCYAESHGLHPDRFLLITLFGVMTDFNFSRRHSESYRPEHQEIFQGICMGTRSITEFDMAQSPLREITRTMRRRRIVKWGSYLIECPWGKGNGFPQNAKLIDADLHDITRRLNERLLDYPQTGLRLGIAPDFANINDEVIVGPEDLVLRNTDDPSSWDIAFAWRLKRGFVLRFSHGKCEDSHRGVPHYNLIGECAVVDGWVGHFANWELPRLIATENFDMCLQ